MPSAFVIAAIQTIFDVVIIAGSWQASAIQVGTWLVISWLSNPDLSKPQDRSSTTPGRGSIAAWQYIYGTVRTPGVNTFVHVSGENNEFLNTVNILAAHRVEEIGQMYFNNEPIEIDGNGDAVGRFSNNVHVDKKLGEINQTAITDLIDITQPFRPGLRLDGNYQYGISTSAANNPNTISIGLTFNIDINKNSTLLSMENGWRINWNDDYSISFIDASGIVTKLVDNPVNISSPFEELSDSYFHNLNITLFVTATPTDVTIFWGTTRTYKVSVIVYDDPPSIVEETKIYEKTVSVSASYNKGSSTGKIYVGSFLGISNFFGGSISNVAIWNVDKSSFFYILSANKRTPLFGAMGDVSMTEWPSEPDYTDIEVAWNMEEDTGDVIDKSVASGSNDLIIKGAWTLAHTLNSRSYVRTLLTWDVELFSKGVPPQAFDVKGKLVPDFANVQTISSIDFTTNTFTLVSHGRITGDIIELFTPDGVLPGGSSAFVEFYLEKITDDTFKIHSIPVVSGGTPVDLTDNGSGTIKFIKREWSANAARCTMDYLHDPFIGMRIGFEEFDESSWIAAIGICDEAVSRTNDPDEARYEANGILSSSKTPKENIQSLLTAMGGTLVYVGDRWFVYASAWRAPAITLDEDDFVSSMDIQTLVPRRENFNAVRGIFVYPNANWEPTDFPPITSSVFEVEDGGERVYTDITLPFTTSYSAAQRLAKIVLFKQRETINLRVTAKLSAFQSQPGDVIKINNSRMGWTDKEFEILSGQLKVDAETGIVYSLVLRETNSGVYSWSTEESEIGFLNNTALPDAAQIVPPFIELSSGTSTLFERADGTIHSRVKIAITCTDPYVNNGGRYEIQFKKTSISASIWEQFGSVSGDSTETFLLDVEDGDSYDVRVRSINTAGLISGWIEELGHIVIGKTEAPSDVIVFKVYQKGEVVVFEWDPITDLDRDGYEFRYGRLDTTWDAAILITNETKGTQVTNAAIPPSPIIDVDGNREAWRFFIKAIDTSDNYSTNEAVFDLLVTPTFAANFSKGQAPAWLGIKTDMIRDPKTGLLHAKDQAASSSNDYNLFDNYIVTAPTTYAYETPEIDIGYDDKVDVWADIWGRLPLEIGNFTPVTSLDYRLEAGVFDGFDIWTNGQVTGRHFKMKFLEESSDSLTVVEDFVPTILIVEHVEADVPIVVPVGGLIVSLGISFNDIPVIEVIPPASPSGVQTVIMAITRTTFTVFFLSSAGVDIGGTGTYTATGR